MHKCDICKKNADRLIPLKEKNVCKECFTEFTKGDLNTGNLDFGACI